MADVGWKSLLLANPELICKSQADFHEHGLLSRFVHVNTRQRFCIRGAPLVRASFFGAVVDTATFRSRLSAKLTSSPIGRAER